MLSNRSLSICLLLAAAGISLSPFTTAAAAPKAFVIIDDTTGFVLDSGNAEKKLPIASLTKIATAMVVLDWADANKVDLSKLATVPNSAASLSTPQGVGFRAGDQCSLRDLLYASLLQSDNQAAETLADHVGRALGAGSSDAPVFRFVAQMNALAKQLGMLRTKFLNPHGLDTLEVLPYSTAADLAKLCQYSMKNSGFRFYVSQAERKILVNINGGSEQTAYLLRNTNELLGKDAIDGVKTGTTRKAGQCLILSSAKAPESREEAGQVIITPRRVDVILLNATERFESGKQLMERAWQLYESWTAAGRPAKGWKPNR